MVRVKAVRARRYPARRIIPNCRVGRLSETAIRDMLGFMALGRQPAGKGWWQLGIDQKTHQATGSTGWSLWRAAYSRVAVMSSGSSRG
jgi:hypothetical protein